MLQEMKTVQRSSKLILGAYPKLNECGGFELLKLSGMTRSKKLSLIPCPSIGYTIKLIKNQTKSALIYIRPMQKNIATTPVEPESVLSGPKEKCLICAEEFFFNDLKDHAKRCRSASEISRASTSICPSNSHPNPAEGQSSTDAATLQLVDLTEDDLILESLDESICCQQDLEFQESLLEDQEKESLDEWRCIRFQQDLEFQDSLRADQEKHDLEKKSLEREERRRKAIYERQLRMAGIPEAPHGVPLRFKYPSGNTRTRRFILSESIQILFDFVGEQEDATEYFHIQDALSVTTLKSNMSGTLLENNVSGSKTLYVHWIQADDPEFVPVLDSNNHLIQLDSYKQAEPPCVNNQLTCSSLPSPVCSTGNDISFSPEGTDLRTILNQLGEKIDHSSCPTSNHINICRDYTGNVHNILRSTLQAFKRRRCSRWWWAHSRVFKVADEGYSAVQHI